MNVVVFAIRGCPAGWLGAYGNEWVGTPHLDRFAAEAVVFDRHVSDCPDPAAACRAWLGGESVPVLDALRSAHVRTVLVRANHPDTDAPEWFYAPWGEVFDARPQEGDKSPLDELIRALPGVLERLSSTPDFLLWVEIDRLLPPWDVSQDVFEAYLDQDDDAKADPVDDEEEDDSDPDAESEPATDEAEFDAETVEAPAAEPAEPVTPWADPPTGPFDDKDPDAREWLHASFAAVVTKLDAELGALFDQLRARGLDESAAWLATTDYGYPLGEHGQIGRYRPWLYEELVHLPLIVRLPGAAEAGRRVDGFTQSPDLAPTLLELFGVQATSAVVGHNLLPLARGEVEAVRPHAVTALTLGSAEEASIRTEDWALLLPLKVPDGETRGPRLFAKPDDRWEVNDVHSGNVARIDELEEQLRQLIGPRIKE